MLLVVLIAMAVVQGVISLRDGIRNTRYVHGYRSPQVPEGKVVVFCPVKGAEADLESNARSLLSQRHPDHSVVFLVDDLEDDAVRVLDRVGATVVAGGRSEQSSQKVHNLLAGISRFGAAADIFVFADADAWFPPSWLSDLIAPLGDDSVGATTGYRWYIPQKGSLASLLRSAWNATVAGFLGPHPNNFLWGGSMAVRREVFTAAGIHRLWERAVSDDYALTYGIRRHGLDIVFVPPCLVPASEGCNWRGLVEFTTRQMRITRVYAPSIWRLGFATTTLFNLTFVWMTLAVLSGRIGILAPWVLIYALTVVRSEVRLRGIGHVIDHPSLAAHRWFYRLSAPLVSLLYELDFFLSAASRRIVWKGVVYTMASPEDTRVEFPGGPE